MSPVRRRLRALVGATLVVATAIPLAATPVAAVSPNLVISQVYGGGGNTGATLRNDFIELYNRGSVSVSVAGWSVQYASSTGSTWQKTELSGTVAPGAYYLVQQAAGAGGTQSLPTPNATGSIPMSSTVGKVALSSTTTLLSGTCPTGLIDFLGYGLATNCSETAPTANLSNTTAALRNGSGATDTDDNLSDFTVGAPNPRSTVPLTVSINDVTAAEGDAGTTSFDFTVSLTTPAAAGGVTFDIATADDTASSPSDFTANSLTGQMIPAGSSTYAFSVIVNGDTSVEPDETFFVNVTNVSGATVGDAQAQGTITSDDVDPCTQPYTAIPSIQGSGATVALTGTRTTQGVVVGDYEGPSPALRGFFIQDLTGDGDAATSDGLFVFEGSNADTVSVGDVVRVTGTAGENQGQSQISVTTIVDCGTATAQPTDIDFPVASADFLERYEGMLVRVPETMYVTEHFQLGRFGQVVLSSDGRLAQPTNVVEPGAPALTLQAANSLRKIILDDASQQQNPDPILYGRGGDPLSAANTLRGGDTITGLVGVLNFTWAGNSASGNAYRIRPATPGTGYEFQPANARPTSAPDVGGETRVAGLNLLNYFNTFDGSPDTADNCRNGLDGATADCRGADTATEFARQWPKTVAAILRIDPDVIGVNEIENDGYGPDSAIAHLVDRLNEATAPGTYAFIDADAGTGTTNALGTDAIKVGLLYKPGSVTPVGTTAALNTTAFVNGGDAAPRSRPSLAQAFEDNATGERFVVDTNHLKSKGSACDDPDEGDGQGNCNLVRVAAATELVAWLATDPTGTDDPDVLVIGDLNSYAMEDPITVFSDAGYANLVAEAIGADAYSYVFDGQWGYLDHALGNATLTGQVAGVGEYHINADEPAVLDYNTDFKTSNLVTTLYAADEFRVSDHDPILIGLDLAAVPVVDEPSVEPEPSVEEEAVVASATFTDNDASADTCTVDYGDGSGAVAGTVAGGTCTGPSHVYGTYGEYTVNVAVTDDDGTGSNTTTHDVNFDFDGFFQPVDMAGANEVRAGASVPFKFTIGGDKGLAILAEGSPGSKPVACTGSGSAGPLEETVSAGSSGLQYDPATGTYTYSWKTSKGWANTCRAFTLTLVDGTTHTALFDFTR